MIGNILKTLRERHDYNQDYVAEKVNIKRSTYANYERESREPSIDMLIKLADLYVVLCQDLVQHKMRNFNYFQLTNRDSLATLAL